MTRYGITVPLTGLSLPEHRDVVGALPELGYTDVWSAEAGGADAFTPLALASAWAPRLRLGTAIVPAYTRGPATLAQCAATLAAAAPGRVAIGVGSSSPVIVRGWNDIPFTKPYQRVRDTLLFLRAALEGQKISQRYETFAVEGFRLQLVPDQPPSLLVAALRPGMLRLAGTLGDGAILNWLSADDVRTVVPYVREGQPDKEIVARVFVAPSTETGRVREVARKLIATYLTVPVYRAFHEWLGRTDQLGDMWQAWAAGDRSAAYAAVPDDVVDALVVHGSTEQCRAHLQRYADAGVDTVVLAVLPVGVDIGQSVRALSPRSLIGKCG
jgi:probable F420-dependent oxidoreductase